MYFRIIIITYLIIFAFFVFNIISIHKIFIQIIYKLFIKKIFFS